VNAETAERLLAVNRRFYQDRGHDFSETRLRLPPGVRRMIDSMDGADRILDLGCGNAGLARELSRRGHHGSYLGLDGSLPLLNEAALGAFSFPVQFLQADLAHLSSRRETQLPSDQASLRSDRHSGLGESHPMLADHWSIVTAFAVLHHLPSLERRLDLLAAVRHWIHPDGRFINSNWQFLTNPRLKARVQPWGAIGLTAADVDPNDYLLDWRHGCTSLRYVHQFDEAELADLAAVSGFVITESFYSDGANRRSGLYQIWRSA
jgi:tRNA (uracil-5-)-methyltransferase TRM9